MGPTPAVRFLIPNKTLDINRLDLNFKEPSFFLRVALFSAQMPAKHKCVYDDGETRALAAGVCVGGGTGQRGAPAGI